MKEYPEPNYFVKITPIEGAIGLEIAALLPGAYEVRVNHVVSLMTIPHLPTSPWPPPFPDYSENWQNRDEAAWYVFGTNEVTVVPADEADVCVQTVMFEQHELAHTAFRMPRRRYDALIADVERFFDEPARESRLNDLGSRPIASFLRHELPRAELSAYDRRILCLDDRC